MAKALVLLVLALLAGCSSPPSTPEQEMLADEVPTADEGTPYAFAGGGSLALGNCSDTFGACVLNIGNPLAPGSANILHFSMPDAPSAIGSAHLTVSWKASSPLTDQLEARFSFLESPQGPTHEVLVAFTGPSPINLELPAAVVPDGLLFGVSVARAEVTAGERVSTLQDVHVDVVVVPA